MHDLEYGVYLSPPKDALIYASFKTSKLLKLDTAKHIGRYGQ